MYTYEDVIGKIEASRRFGNLPGVEVARRALDVLGHPERGLRFVHVAGTNGKGSVCAFLSSILKQAGCRVGMFTSPHLVSFEERIVVDGVCIPKEDVARLGNRLLLTDFGVTPTMFDYCLLMAVLYFREQGCDIAVMETGLGGRLDSTNALGTPEVSVITKIGLDHMEILGSTLTEIAGEKAGILKKGSVFVMGVQEPEVESVLLESAEKAGVRSVHKVTPECIESIREIKLRLPGIHQRENAAAAVLAVKNLPSFHVDMDRESRGDIGEEDLDRWCKRGLEDAVWRGRMEIISRSPFLMVDGAHNACGVRALCDSLKALYPGEKFHFLVGVMADKDYKEMMDIALPLAAHFTTATPESSRALQAEQLAEWLRGKGVKAQSTDRLCQAIKGLSKEEKTVAFGSLYFVGELEAMAEAAEERQDAITI